MIRSRNIVTACTRTFMHRPAEKEIEYHPYHVPLTDEDRELLGRYIAYLRKYPNGVNIVHSMRYIGCDKRWKSHLTMLPYLEQIVLVWIDENKIGICE
jgi:hypothetical protein